MNDSHNTNIAIAVCATAFAFVANGALAQAINFSNPETIGTNFVASLRGTLATVFFTLAFIVTGFLAAFNKISWVWVGGVVLGAFFVFGGPALVANLRSTFS